jgi:cytochrome c peroxidase
VIGRAALAPSALVLTAAVAAPWRWTLPAGIAAPMVPADNPMSAAKIALGRHLFYDADLSIDGTMSCASCHEQKHAFADGNPTRPGVHGDAGRRTVPGLANVAWLPVLTAAGPRVTTLEAQAAIPIFGLSPVGMGMHGSEREIPRRLSRDACYRRQFRKAFPRAPGADRHDRRRDGVGELRAEHGVVRHARRSRRAVP